MNALRFYLWKEWREHQKALLAVALVCTLMMAGFAWFFASQRVLREPLFPMAACMVAVSIAVLAVGGELLAERQAGRLAWLQRLPVGLATPFWAKLVFHVATTLVAGVLGIVLAFAAAWLRGAAQEGSEAELAPGALLLTALFALWSFAASSWSSRSVLSFLSAALVLAALGFPAWRVIHAGYQPTRDELALFSALLTASALAGAWLGFVHGTRFGREVLSSALFGLAPGLLVLAVTAGWSVKRMGEREVFDPLADDFTTWGQMLSDDGRTAFLVGRNEPSRWDPNALPTHVLRIDLERSSFERLGQLVREYPRYVEDERGRLDYEQLVIVVAERETPLVFDLRDGQPGVWDAEMSVHRGWRREGLGLHLFDARQRQDVIRDPFRGRDYPARAFGDATYNGRLLVRPGRWLHAPSAARWYWLDPETNERTAVDWPEHSEPLVLFEDGRVLLANALEGLQLVHPELGHVESLDSQGVETKHIQANWNGLRVPNSTSGNDATGGTIVLQTFEDAWLVLDAEATSVRRLPVANGVRFLQRIGASEAIVEDSHDGQRLARMDLTTGALTRLWPPETSN